ncbi:nitrate regulatory protein [Spongiibacter sp.]|uniref:nitrate regulatory protein n=1 Tax=Spongiibacter sp. TaxID=2024860 RepID=UPI000C6B0C3C|nr:nitrate regulatory protein [Spongiibacter sp.]MBU73386.1 hypothetical protein [Spongiibacter sp.]
MTNTQPRPESMSASQLSSQDFLLAAKQAEIHSLKQLELSCGLVTHVTALIHELQRERGLSNIYLVSRGSRGGDTRAHQLGLSTFAVDAFREALGSLELNSMTSAATLLNRIAVVLHRLDSLDALRQQVNAREIAAANNTDEYNQLIADLLALIFEAADISGDPQITQALVAMFNFLQGKEYAGQERAWGVIGFSAGEFSKNIIDRLNGLQYAQQRCLDIFSDVASTDALHCWESQTNDSSYSELARMRQMIRRYEPGEQLPTTMAEIWYELTTHRIDAMQRCEQRLAQELLTLCEAKIDAAEMDLQQHHRQLATLSDTVPLSSLGDEDDNADTTLNIGPGVNVRVARSIFDLVQHQAERLRELNDALGQARQTLEERKLIDKAKGILIKSRNITEEQAYRQLREAAMSNNKRMVDVAANVISVAEMLDG